MINNLFLSVGAMKAGTTWLYERLKDHPDVSFTQEKEIHYFANKVGIENQLNHHSRILKLKSILNKYGGGNPKYIAENIQEISWYVNYAKPNSISNEWYISLFDDPQSEKYCADFSNLYCQMSSDGWENVHKTSRKTRVIYTLRDPMQRLWSHYKFHHKWTGKEDSVLDDGFEVFKDTLSKPWFYKNMDYAGNLKKVYAGVGQENVLLLYFEDFRSNPQLEADKISSFLGISQIHINEEDNNKKVNSTKGYGMPDEWREYAANQLSDYISEMKDFNIFHESW
ncbi:sulfotransferase [Cobetia sp. L2A1]|uniref:sulfotransferase n=1 Tax=Cobetia sp. L2A1 TaxID=2686360 RepID=UPI00131A9EB2|nr:sulfotransferase [Cobetia sp. L2A1]